MTSYRQGDNYYASSIHAGGLRNSVSVSAKVICPCPSVKSSVSRRLVASSCLRSHRALSNMLLAGAYITLSMCLTAYTLRTIVYSSTIMRSVHVHT